jgi:hypothetical protein
MDPTIGDVILRLFPVNENTRLAIKRPQNVHRLITQGREIAIQLTFTSQPKEIHKGFVFGSDESCDVFLDSSRASGRHFAITFNPSSGSLLVVNKSSAGTMVGQKMILERDGTQVTEESVSVDCDGLRFMAVTPDRGRYQADYTKKLGKYLGYLLAAGPCTSRSLHAPPTTPIVPRKKVGPYVEIQSLGNGGFGEVYLFAESRTGEIFAARRFKDSANIREIKREIGTLKNLSHVSKKHTRYEVIVE